MGLNFSSSADHLLSGHCTLSVYSRPPLQPRIRRHCQEQLVKPFPHNSRITFASPWNMWQSLLSRTA